MHSRSISFTLTPRKAAFLTLIVVGLALLFVAGCTAAAKQKAVADVSTALTGNPDPSSPAATQPSGDSIEGKTQQFEQVTATAATIPGPQQPFLLLISQLAALALVVERVAVYGTAAIKNSLGSPSDSNSQSATGAPSTQPAGVASGSPTIPLPGSATLPAQANPVH